MANNSKVEYTGIKDISKLTTKGNINSLLVLALLGVNYAKLAAPVDEGNLRASIGYKMGTGKGENLEDVGVLKINEAAVGTNVVYAPYMEFGTRFVAPRPYLRPSMALLRGDAPSVVAKKMDDEFKKGVLGTNKERVVF